jgi:hypothetical protein
MSTWLPLASAVPLAQGQSNNWDIAVEARGTLDGGTTWSDWRPVTRTTMTVEGAEFRITGLCYDLATAINIITCEVSVDVPDRIASGQDVAFDSGGHAMITYAPAFHAKPNVQLTVFSPGAFGASAVLLSSDKYGFTVEQRRDGGATVAGGAFNWQALGYGVST